MHIKNLQLVIWNCWRAKEKKNKQTALDKQLIQNDNASRTVRVDIQIFIGTHFIVVVVVVYCIPLRLWSMWRLIFSPRCRMDILFWMISNSMCGAIRIFGVSPPYHCTHFNDEEIHMAQTIWNYFHFNNVLMLNSCDIFHAKYGIFTTVNGRKPSPNLS